MNASILSNSSAFELPLLPLLQSQGFGTKKECLLLIHSGQVRLYYETPNEDLTPKRQERQESARVKMDPECRIDTRGLFIQVGEQNLPFQPRLFLAFNKPKETECSRSPQFHRSVFSFFPEPFIRRGIQTVGRLDADTSGLLFLSDSGSFNHFITSPKAGIRKTYRVGTKHPLTPEQLDKLSTGVLLKDEPVPTLPATLTAQGEKECDISISEGRYHQVKRMFAAAGNRVVSIHRTAIGPICLDDALLPGQWRYMNDDVLSLLGFVSK